MAKDGAERRAAFQTVARQLADSAREVAAAAAGEDVERFEQTVQDRLDLLADLKRRIAAAPLSGELAAAVRDMHAEALAAEVEMRQSLQLLRDSVLQELAQLTEAHTNCERLADAYCLPAE